MNTRSANWVRPFGCLLISGACALAGCSGVTSEVDDTESASDSEGLASSELRGPALSQANATIVYDALRGRGSAIPNTTACAPLINDVQKVVANSSRLAWTDQADQSVDGVSSAIHQGYLLDCSTLAETKIQRAMQAITTGGDADACFRSYDGDTGINDFLRTQSSVYYYNIGCLGIFYVAAVTPGN